MNKFIKSIFDLQELEQYGRRKIWLNHSHPALKIIVTLLYIIALTAVDKYNLARTLIFGVYPIMLIALAEIPYGVIVSKLIIPGLLSISLGFFNPILDREVILIVAGVGVSGGSISLVTLFVKAMFTITATMILVSTTTIERLGEGLLYLKMPKRLVMLLLLTYRYIVVLLNEFSRTMEAYQLRDPIGKGVHISAWGSLVGQVIIRSYARSEEIYNAMLLRGYSADERKKYEEK